MAVLSTLIRSFCCCINADEGPYEFEKPLIHGSLTHLDVQYSDKPDTEEVAEDIVTKLFAAENNDAALQADLQSMARVCGWHEKLADAIRAAMERAIDLGKEMGPAMKAAYEKAIAAINAVEEWANAHPEMAAVITTLIALGILAVMIPWVMAYLGFAEEGILEGELITYFQS
jgi:hypothetical protein